MSHDLGSGSVKKLLFRLAAPAVLAQVVNLLYNIVDRIYIGHIPRIGPAALTGVGLFAPILMLLNAFAMLIGSGGAPLAAIAMGKGDKEKAQRIMGNCFTALFFLSLVLTVVFYIFAPQLLIFFGASNDTLPYALDYSRIYILGTICVLMVMGMNPFITTQGFAKISMLTTVIGAVINIVLDPIFMFVFDLGVRGAAIATVLSQLVSALWILRFLTSDRTVLRLCRQDLRLSSATVLPCLALGVSTFVMLSTESLLSVSFTNSLAKYGTDLDVGAMTVLNSLVMLITMPLSGLCQGSQPLISYNFGAGRYDRVKQTFYTIFAVCVGYSTLFWLALLAAPSLFAGLFVSDEAFAQRAVWAIGIYFACAFSHGFQTCCQQSFVALGQAKISLLLACLRKIVLLIPLIFILPHFFENKVFAVFFAEPVSDVIAAAITTVVFFTSFDKILKQNEIR
ncbi:MAG: MATE family efflux transporter [Oscillospiraceae bacterium]|nr:MATE family efflux transporter [Oscillospiraceae bacterium]